MLQFPKWVTPNRGSFAYLEEVRERLGHYRGAIEFRNALWLDAEHQESTLALLGDLELAFICVDEPQGFASSVPPVAAATTDLAFVRFHGRNAAMWEARTQTSSQRFDYWYEGPELDEWAPRICAPRERGGGRAPGGEHEQLRPGAGQRAPALAATRGGGTRDEARLRGVRGGRLG